MAVPLSSLPALPPPKDTWLFSEGGTAIAKRKGIAHSDLWQLEREDTVAEAYRLFEQEWAQECANKKSFAIIIYYFPFIMYVL